MKNAIIYGLIIGVLSGLWLFIMKALMFSPQSSGTQPVEYLAVLIPLIGLYLGVRSYRNNECGGQMGFLEALLQSFKILLVGGVIAVAGGIIYINEIDGTNLKDFRAGYLALCW
jgi:hypothetical protein